MTISSLNIITRKNQPYLKMAILLWVIALLPMIVVAQPSFASSSSASSFTASDPTTYPPTYPTSTIERGRIIGGNLVRQGDRPWVVALARTYAGSNTQATFCGGSLVHPRWVLTAAHCVTSSSDRSEVIAPDSFKILAGHVDLELAQDFTVQRIYVHGQYASTGLPDLAMLRLDRDVNLPVLPILPNDHPSASPGALLTALGWGVTQVTETGASRLLRQVNVPVIRFSDCQSFWQGQLSERAHICAGVNAGGRDACYGDSGGPLVTTNPDTGRASLVGVVSFGRGCARANTPAVYARPGSFLNWANYLIGKTPVAPASAGAQLSATFTSSCTSLVCTFDAAGSSAGSNPLKTILWSFGDGTWDSGSTAQHAYGVEGDYRVTLFVIDSQGEMQSQGSVVSVATLVSAGDEIKHDFRGVLGARQMAIFPDGNGFRAEAGRIRARIDMPRGTDADLKLLRRNVTTGRWREVARSTGRGFLEYISYQAKAGEYMWSLSTTTGRGSFRLRTRHTD